jgi:hypothetical protein
MQKEEDMNKQLYAWLEDLAKKDQIVYYEDGYAAFGVNPQTHTSVTTSARN